LHQNKTKLNLKQLIKDKIIYQPNHHLESSIEVWIEDETVWLTQAQMAHLFEATKQNISLHINNVFREKELQVDSVVKEYLTTASDGKRYKTKLYNLDVVISVGYRVKSIRGTQFRIWANAILKSYLLKGYAVHNRLEQLERKVVQHDQQLEEIIQVALPPKEGVFFEGQIFDAYHLITSIIKKAKKSIILIDNYVDETVLTLLSKRKKAVKVTIYTKEISKQLELDINKHNAQYEAIQVLQFTKAHDRFLIIDEQEVYFIGASIKDLGKKWFAFSKINIDPNYLLDRLKS
jgi:hypothetical protein